ncbi:MAG: F0F1 ATP synthase subunit delta [Prevotellaceae bacterium]|jgi:F-type H+-transporting ATPase subunit delta|nr:F0F1 ATP synthase subunit delta [Prevotellaceae bacterium]
MNEGLIPSRYAKALWWYAHKQCAEDVVYQQTLQITQVYQTNKRVHTILTNPVLSKEDKLYVIRTIAGGDVSSVFDKFINMLVENERDSFLQRICLKYIDLYREKHNIHYVRLTTAAPVDAATEKRISALINSIVGGTVEVQRETNPDVIGGFIIDVDSTRYDATLTTQLRRIKHGFDEQNRQA